MLEKLLFLIYKVPQARFTSSINQKQFQEKVPGSSVEYGRKGAIQDAERVGRKLLWEINDPIAPQWPKQAPCLKQYCSTVPG